MRGTAPKLPSSDGGLVQISRFICGTREPTPEHSPYWWMKVSKSATTEMIAGLALAIALGATVYYGYLAWLLVSPD